MRGRSGRSWPWSLQASDVNIFYSAELSVWSWRIGLNSTLKKHDPGHSCSNNITEKDSNEDWSTKLAVVLLTILFYGDSLEANRNVRRMIRRVQLLAILLIANPTPGETKKERSTIRLKSASYLDHHGPNRLDQQPFMIPGSPSVRPLKDRLTWCCSPKSVQNNVCLVQQNTPDIPCESYVQTRIYPCPVRSKYQSHRSCLG